MDKTYRGTVIAGNWKMNMLPSQVSGFVQTLKAELRAGKGVTAALCVPFTHLPAMIQAAEGTAIKTGAQDVSFHESGAFTGEVSAAMLTDLGAGMCIIGHSERRGYHGETDADINAKLLALLKTDITPIVCVGESLGQRDGGETLPFITGQVRAALTGVAAEDMPRIVIAYEPIWAIGTGRTASPEQAEEVCQLIRTVIRKLFGSKNARATTILYGGSMNEKNAFDLLAQQSREGVKYDVVILDPPAFTKTRSAIESATRGYKEINLRAMKLVRPGGYLVTCSCSQHILPDAFMAIVKDAAHDARVHLRQVEYRTQGRDHPILPASPETQYLKCGIFQVFE